MKRATSNAALYAVSLLSIASISQAQTPTQMNLKTITTLACYQDVSPLKYDAEFSFATDGWCQAKCGGKNNSVMALTGGSTCYCGDLIPSADKQVDRKNCNTPCNGYGDFTCGGIGYYQLYLTGITGNVKTAANGTNALGASDTESASPSVVTEAGQTVVVTAGGDASNNKGPNKVAIAVGVVVGLVIFGTVVGAIIFFLRQRRRRAIEEEHKRNAAINEFVNSKQSDVSSITDSRLDHSFLSSHRRESIGSIADEMDFSRRILQVRNPDHRASNASNLA